MLVRYFKEKGNGFDRVIGTDCNAYAPALYETDKYYLVPRMTSPDYLGTILQICEDEQIDAVLPLQEDELFLTASHRELFTSKGICPIVSSPETVELCRDKYAFYKYLRKHDLPTLPTCDSLAAFRKCHEEGRMDFPVFVKPVRGCGSTGIRKVEQLELLEALYKYSSEELLIQSYAGGEEYGIDLYVDLLSRKPVSVFIKKKIRMRAGETEKSVSVKDDALFSLARQTAESLSLSGPVDMDVFHIDGKYYISEINPRFGGGYPHAYSCNVNFPKLIAANLAGEENTDTTGSYEDGICMLKYSDLMTLRIEEA